MNIDKIYKLYKKCVGFSTDTRQIKDGFIFFL